MAASDSPAQPATPVVFRERLRLIARLGNDSYFPTQAGGNILTTGEIAWSADMKLMRMGDDTPNPPIIASTKTIGVVDYTVNGLPYTDASGNTVNSRGGGGDGTYIFKNIIAGSINGGNIASLMSVKGIASGDGKGNFTGRTLSNTDGYLSIVNPDGIKGDPNLGVTDKLFTDMVKKGGGIKFSYGTVPPSNPGLGDMFWDTDQAIEYAYIPNGSSGVWLDISSASGGGDSGGNRTTIGSLPPKASSVGDKFFDSSDGYRQYEFTADSGGIYWKEIRL